MLRSRPVTTLTLQEEGEAVNTLKIGKSRKKRRNTNRQKSGIDVLSLVICSTLTFLCYFIISYQHLTSHPTKQQEDEQPRKQLRLQNGSKRIDPIEPEEEEEETMTKLPSNSLYNLQFPSINGELITFSRFLGHASLVINVASE